MGYITHSVSVNLAPLLFACLKRTYDLSLGYLAAFTLVTFVVQIIMDISAAAFMEKVSFRALAVISQLLSGMGLMLLGVLPIVMRPEVGLLIAAVIYSSGGGLSEVLLSPLVEALPHETGSSSLSILHSFYSWGHVAVILITTGVLGILGDALWFLVPILWSLIPFWCARRFATVPMPEMTCHEEGLGMGQLFKCKAFALLLLMMFCSGSAEQIMAQWSSYYAEVGLGVPKVTGDLVGPCIFALMMALGRTLYGNSGGKLRIKTTLTLSAIVTFICFVAAVFVRLPLGSLISLGLSGMGISLMWPGILSLAREQYRGGGASMFAVLAFGGDVGCSVGPFLTGIVSERMENTDTALRCGILTGAIFPMIMLVGVVMISIAAKRKKQAQ